MDADRRAFAAELRSVDVEPSRMALARENLARVGLEAAADLRALVDADDRVTQALVPIGAGVLLVVRG